MNVSPVAAASSAIDTSKDAPASDIAIRRALVHAVHSLNEQGYAGAGREIVFAHDAHSKAPVMRVVDTETHETIEQFPPEYLLALADAFLGKSQA